MNDGHCFRGTTTTWRWVRSSYGIALSAPGIGRLTGALVAS
ncbi:hypothetical protein ACFWP5_04215 [Streptomyces sp. NPDC058469]